MTKVAYIVSDIDKALAFEWIADQLDTIRFDLSFALLNPSSSELESFLQQRGIPVTRIHCSSKKDWPKAWWRLIQWMRQQKPQIIHCHLMTANLLGLSAAKFLGLRKRIYTRHHADYHFRYHPGGVKWDKLCNRLATAIIAPSRVVAEVLIAREGVSPEKVHLIHHGFDLDYFAEPNLSVVSLLRHKYIKPGKAPIIGVISRFTELKGIQYIIPAFKRILAEYPNAYLLLFNARGDYQKELMEQLSELPDFSFRAVAFESNLSEVYALFDVFVQVSADRQIEAFGQTYVEALAAGVPSVFTLAGIAGDFVKHRSNALVVPFRDADAIYEALHMLLKEPALAQSIARQGKEDVYRLFDINKMIGNLQGLYKA